MKTYNHTINGKIVATYEDTPLLPRKRKTLAQFIRAAKFARTNARLVNILTK